MATPRFNKSVAAAALSPQRINQTRLADDTFENSSCRTSEHDAEHEKAMLRSIKDSKLRLRKQYQQEQNSLGSENMYLQRGPY